MAEAQLTDNTVAPPEEPRRVTLEQYLDLLAEAGYEVLDGDLTLMTPQELPSSDIAHVLYDSLHPHVTERKLGLLRMETAFALEIEPGTTWVKGSLVPDLAFISMERLRDQREKYPGERVFRVVPNLVVEVVSSSDRFSVVLNKVRRYLKYGVQLVWVIDPQNRVIYVYTPDQPDGHALHEDEMLTGAPVLPEWSIAIRTLLDAGPNVA